MAQDAFSAADLLGSVIDGRFEILEKLGEGGMGAIYKARQLSVDRIVALKILLHDQRGDPISVERFRHEAYLASRLKHPNAIVIHDFGQSERGLLYIAMEFLAGETLKARLRRVGPTPVETAVKVMSQALRTIAEAHRMGLVHRDLKPDNIFLTRVEGDEDYVKVLDFGIAKLTAVQEGADIDGGYQGGLTVQGKIYGTPNYMSPEQIRGKTVDQQSDLYSLGVIFYEVLAGRLPFSGETPVDVMMMHLRDEPASLRSLRPEVPVELERTVLRALEKDRRARYQTGDEFLEALENYKFNSGFYAVQAHLGLPVRPAAVSLKKAETAEDDEEEQGETLLLGDDSASTAAAKPGRALAEAPAFGLDEDDEPDDATAIGVASAAPVVEERTILELPEEEANFNEPTVFESDEDDGADDNPFSSVGGDSLDGGLHRAAPRAPAAARDEMTMLELDDEELEEVEPSRVVPIPTAEEPNAPRPGSIRRTAFQPALGLGAPTPVPAPARAAPTSAPATRAAPRPSSTGAPVTSTSGAPQHRTVQGLPRLASAPSADEGAAPSMAPPPTAPRPVRNDAPTPPPAAIAPVAARPTQTNQRPTVAVNLPVRDGSRRAILLGLTFFVLVGAGAAAVVLLDPFGGKKGGAAAEGPPIVHIDSEPAGVEVFDRGLYVENPAQYSAPPSGQPHDLQFASPDRRTFKAKVAERSGSSWLFVKIPPGDDSKLAQATVTSEPSGATVKVGGKPVGRTPLTYLGAPGTAVTFELELEGYAVEKRESTPTSEGVDVSVALKEP